MWQRVEVETGSRSDVVVELIGLREWGMEPEDLDCMPERRKGIDFVAKKRI